MPLLHMHTCVHVSAQACLCLVPLSRSAFFHACMHKTPADLCLAALAEGGTTSSFNEHKVDTLTCKVGRG